MTEKRKRRWFQFSLRTLLVLVLVASLPCRWLAVKIQQKERERRAVEAIWDLGGWVLYDFEVQGTEALGPSWLRKLLGEDFFSDVTYADLIYRKVSDDGLQYLKSLTNLEELDLTNTQCIDDGLQDLVKGLTNLQGLDLSETHLTDDGLQHLKGLTNLEMLDLTNTQATPEGIEKLRQALPNCNIRH
jgi:hypothetical protein